MLSEQRFIDKHLIWSMNSIYPTIARNPEYDHDMAFWAGCVMTHKMALVVSCSLAKIFIGQKAKSLAERETLALLSCGAFGVKSEIWYQMLCNRYGAISNYYENVVRASLHSRGITDITSEYAKECVTKVLLEK